MSRHAKLTTVLTALVPMLATGCAISGKWSLATVDPEAARRDFEFSSLTLQQDGSFYAESLKEGVRTTSGTYTYEDKTLTLAPHAGPKVAYDARFIDGDHLELMKVAEGQKVITTFKRVE